MNNRQAGKLREMIKKEESVRNKWADSNLGNENMHPNYAPSRNTGGNYYPVPSGYDAPVPPSDIYDRAIRISSPRMVEADEIGNETVRRKVIRQVEVPYTRRVKVPVKTRKIIPTTVEKKVKTKKLVEVPSYKIVDEKYTIMEERPAIRQKEVWVRKLVPERYMKQVPVEKVRQVKVPTTVIQEVDDYEIVRVGGSKAVDVDGFRVDEVEDSKLVEVEEFQTFQLRPHATGSAKIIGTREIGPIRGVHHSRRVGNEVFHVEDERISTIPSDENPSDISSSSLPRRTRTPMGSRSQQRRRPGSRSAARPRYSPQPSGYYPQSPQQQQQPVNPYMYGGGYGYPTSPYGAPPQQGTYNHPYNMMAHSAPRPRAPQRSGRMGFKVRNTHSNGVIVFKVHPGEAAERAGIRTGDVITYANNRPTRNLVEFRQVVGNSSGPILLQVRRRGMQKLNITVQR